MTSAPIDETMAFLEQHDVVELVAKRQTTIRKFPSLLSIRMRAPGTALRVPRSPHSLFF